MVRDITHHKSESDHKLPPQKLATSRIHQHTVYRIIIIINLVAKVVVYFTLGEV